MKAFPRRDGSMGYKQNDLLDNQYIIDWIRNSLASSLAARLPAASCLCPKSFHIIPNSSGELSLFVCLLYKQNDLLDNQYIIDWIRNSLASSLAARLPAASCLFPKSFHIVLKSSGEPSLLLSSAMHNMPSELLYFLI